MKHSSKMDSDFPIRKQVHLRRAGALRDVPPVPASNAIIDDKIELVCPSGHRTTHSLARVMRLNDAWCGICGADISNNQLVGVDRSPQANGTAQRACKIVPDRI